MRTVEIKPMDIVIRTADPTEYEDVYHLIKEFAIFIKTPDKVKITPEQMIKDEKYFNCLVAVHGKTICLLYTSDAADE